MRPWCSGFFATESAERLSIRSLEAEECSYPNCQQIANPEDLLSSWYCCKKLCFSGRQGHNCLKLTGPRNCWAQIYSGFIRIDSRLQCPAQVQALCFSSSSFTQWTIFLPRWYSNIFRFFAFFSTLRNNFTLWDLSPGPFLFHSLVFALVAVGTVQWLFLM